MLLKNLLKRWRKEEDGVVAVEFALIAIPFTFLLIGIIELSFIFAGSSILEGATQSASRIIRTGQLQQSEGNQEDMFRTALCDSADIFLSCDNIMYEVIHLNSFSDAENYEALFEDDGSLSSRGFDPGGVNDVILIRTAYRQTLVTPFFGDLFSTGEGQTVLLMSTVVLQTEPYDQDEDET